MITLTKGALAMVLAGAVTFSITNALLDKQSSKRVTTEIALTQSGAPKKADAISQAKKTVEDPTPTTNVKDSETKLSHDNPAIQAAFKNSNKGNKAREAIPLNKKQFSKSTTSNSANTNKATSTTPAVTTKPATSSTASTTASASTTRTNKPSEVPTSTVTMKPVTTAKAPATTTTASKPTETNEPSEASTPVAPTKPETSAKTPPTTAPTPSGTNTTSLTTNTSNRGQQISEAAKEKASIHRDQKENNGKKM
ncbi:hypothetical protein [Metabacillus sp. FJAT-53654]|uniref:Uncharacterized protein n=1 Tax=Metabacillus rhizosphaerae TaxID=3117747 RepID=A0ABZ2MVH0_9BACI